LSSSRHILTLSCPDRIGVVANVTQYLADRGANVLEAQHFRDELSNRSVMRLVFELTERGALDALAAGFEEVARRLQMTWELHDAARRMRVVVAVSRQGHCFNSLLHRWSVGTLPIEIVAVLSNHEEQQRLAQWHGLPFHHLPIEPGGKAQQERRMLRLFHELEAELLVLARYMQILSSEMCRELSGRAINIHHSFLPGFKGARPYHQAYARGVKLIGATAHYVNDDLDEGPIIEQAVERVDHTMSPEHLTTLGNEIESVVLNRAVQWHAEHRIFEFGNRTVILR
jgi:formyltetrahydrofolate deformylase